jgi:hypothetical protein
MNRNKVAAALIMTGLVAGCGGGGGGSTSSTPSASSLTAVSGKVADGYLYNAIVFMDKNGNYQYDVGEPYAVTGQNGQYTLNVAPGDVGKYPIVAIAVKGQTIDMDNPGQTLANGYAMSLPAAAVSGSVSSFISPMSTLVRENMAANPGLSLTDAMTQLRNQMNLPSGTNVMADYIGMASSSDAGTASSGALMHTAATDMATLMSGQAAQVIGTSGTTTTVDVNRFRTMMGEINLQLPQMVQAMKAGATQNQTMMGQMTTSIGALVSSVAPTVSGMPFRNMTSLFPSMSGVRFWNMTGNPIPFLSGMMGGKGSGSATGGNTMGK